jgi:hypothetical protein
MDLEVANKAATPNPTAGVATAKLQACCGDPPLSFKANQWQIDPQVRLLPGAMDIRSHNT